MQVLRHSRHLEIILFQAEAFLLRQSLDQIVAHYRVAPEDWPEEVQDRWLPGGMTGDDEDIEIWKQNLRDFRGENSLLAEKLLKQLAEAKVWPLILPLPLDQADAFLTLINDHRLYLAAVNQVGEKEMNTDWEVLSATPEKMAVMNIHFLAWLIELVVLRLE